MGERRRRTVAGRMRMHAHAWMAASFGLRPASRRNSFYSPQPEWNPTHTVVFLSTLCLSLLFMKTVNIAVALLLTILLTFCDHPHWFPLATSWKKTSEAHHLNECEEVSRPTSDPRPLEPVFNSCIIPALLCTSLLSSSCHFYPHFLTPSWLLWPLNVSRWQDTTPIVIHPALSDHCVSALVNTDPPPLPLPSCCTP